MTRGLTTKRRDTAKAEKKGKYRRGSGVFGSLGARKIGIKDP
jgi:hypothetical protein